MLRRIFLIAGAASICAKPALAFDLVPGAELERSDGRISWEEFIARAQAVAQRLITDRSRSGQRAYLHAIAQHAALLGELPTVDPEDFGELDPSYSFEMLRYAAPFAAIYWRMEAGGIYPAHNHPSTNVCTLCTGGAAIVRNFSLPSAAPPINLTDVDFDLFEAGREVLQAGSINLVDEHERNVHWFEAGPDGAEGIDITTTYGAMAPFSFLRLGAASVEAPGVNRFRARWVGNDPRRALT